MVAQVSDWHQRWTEPQRLRSRYAGLEQFNRNSAWFGITTSPFLRDWFRPLSEPVRRKPPLPIGALPFLFQVEPHIGYRFSISEPGGAMTLTMYSYPAPAPGKGKAQVSIREIEVGNQARVAIMDLKDGTQ